MKYNPKTGKVKLEAGEVRIGNFAIKDEGVGDINAHIRITDLNSTFSHRVWKRMPIGMWLDNKLRRGNEDDMESLKVYVSVMWSLFSLVPDDELMQDIIDNTQAALERHPDWYGVKKPSAEGDEKDLQAVREMKEFEGDVKGLEEKE